MDVNECGFDNCVDNMSMFRDTLSERQPEMDIFVLQDSTHLTALMAYSDRKTSCTRFSAGLQPDFSMPTIHNYPRMSFPPAREPAWHFFSMIV